jgi:hypothetical protein
VANDVFNYSQRRMELPLSKQRPHQLPDRYEAGVTLEMGGGNRSSSSRCAERQKKFERWMRDHATRQDENEGK